METPEQAVLTAPQEITAAHPQATPESQSLEKVAIDSALARPADNRPFEIQKFEFQQRAARLFAASGLFADIKGQTQEQAIAQAFTKIALGDSMGFSPAESMTGIDLIAGRVSIGASLRAARLQRAGYSWDILQLDDKGCRLRLKYQGRYLMCEEIDPKNGTVSSVPTIVSFTVDDAARAALIGKDNYKKNPRNMFFARAITNAQRWYAPGVLGVDILSTEEVIDMEPLPTQDASLARKATNNLERIKNQYTDQKPEIEAGTENPQPPAAATQPNQSSAEEKGQSQPSKKRGEPKDHGVPGIFEDGK